MEKKIQLLKKRIQKLMESVDVLDLKIIAIKKRRDQFEEKKPKKSD